MATQVESVDWSKIPPPRDDGAADHLTGLRLPELTLKASDGSDVALGALAGCSVLYTYPMTGRPDKALPEGWDMIPGARGCTPQSCAFRDHRDELTQLGVRGVYGISVQDSDYQAEAAKRLHLPFSLLSDSDYRLAKALNLPKIEVQGVFLLARLTMVVQDGLIEKVFYPVFPPDENAQDVLRYLSSR